MISSAMGAESHREMKILKIRGKFKGGIVEVPRWSPESFFLQKLRKVIPLHVRRSADCFDLILSAKIRGETEEMDACRILNFHEIPGFQIRV